MRGRRLRGMRLRRARSRCGAPSNYISLCLFRLGKYMMSESSFRFVTTDDAMMRRLSCHSCACLKVTRRPGPGPALPRGGPAGGGHSDVQAQAGWSPATIMMHRISTPADCRPAAAGPAAAAAAGRRRHGPATVTVTRR